MSQEVLRVALQRLPDEIYTDHFEAEFGARDGADDPAVPPAAEEEVPEAAADEAAESEIDMDTLEQDLGECIDAMLAAGASTDQDMEDSRGDIRNKIQSRTFPA